MTRLCELSLSRKEVVIDSGLLQREFGLAACVVTVGEITNIFVHAWNTNNYLGATLHLFFVFDCKTRTSLL